MRIVRDESSWLVLFPDGRPAQCLKGLAVRCGFRVGELSDALGHSERYVQDVFGRDLGVPPKIWLRKERMEVAARLLSEGLMPGEVAVRLGFSEGSGFRREFRKRYGMTPSEYARWSGGDRADGSG
jgi:AraC-like DNA-binding protein